jgi:hypothetical protein
MEVNTLARIVRWIARITGSLLLLFLLWMLVGHLTGSANGPHGMTFRSTGEILAFVLFPVCTMAGLAMAYRRELLGGATVVGSIALLCALRPDLVQPYFLALTVPGVLYLLYWALQRKSGTGRARIR